ncbi:hypothetical protein NL533_32425, partial [Klebsiella pneumoniae]|nr:hypothetical protein [Klebsiella pneumoniae]
GHDRGSIEPDLLAQPQQPLQVGLRRIAEHDWPSPSGRACSGPSPLGGEPPVSPATSTPCRSFPCFA